jgi:hypothetical protein
MALFFGKDLVIWAFECYEEDDWLQFDFDEQIWQDLIKEIKKHDKDIDVTGNVIDFNLLPKSNEYAFEGLLSGKKSGDSVGIFIYISKDGYLRKIESEIM